MLSIRGTLLFLFGQSNFTTVVFLQKPSLYNCFPYFQVAVSHQRPSPWLIFSNSIHSCFLLPRESLCLALKWRGFSSHLQESACVHSLLWSICHIQQTTPKIKSNFYSSKFYFSHTICLHLAGLFVTLVSTHPCFG